MAPTGRPLGRDPAADQLVADLAARLEETRARDGNAMWSWLDDQCPNCTSPYRHHAFAMPTGDGAANCDHDWHNQKET